MSAYSYIFEIVFGTILRGLSLIELYSICNKMKNEHLS